MEASRTLTLFGQPRVAISGICDDTVSGFCHTSIGGSVSFVRRSGLPELNRPQMILTGARIAGTGEPVRLRYEEETEFTAMWEDYLTNSSQAVDVQELT